MAAGVGKTYAMLSMAKERLQQGVDVVVGVVETHGRAETMKMLEGLPIIPKKKWNYGESIIEEMDLESILRRKPKIALVDELAHTNPQGSRHTKRWQDVFEILDSGIDVYTTINIQHIESRKDDIESITSTSIFETVPDSVIERANHIEVVDLPPEDLLARLKEGKVYFPEKAEQAAANFFKENKLASLRQVLLRYSADKIYGQSTDSINKFKIQDKILVVFNSHLEMEKLLRVAKKYSDNLRCPWCVLYINDGRQIIEKEQKKLKKQLDLARNLGAEISTTSDGDLFSAIERTCSQLGITQVLFGGVTKSSWIEEIKLWLIVSRLRRIVSVQLVAIEKSTDELWLNSIISKINFPPYVMATGYIFALSVINAYLFHEWSLMSYKSIGFVFLTGISIAGFMFKLGPTVLVSILGFLIWDFFFIPPLYTFHINSVEDVAFALTFFAVATVAGALNSIAKRNQVLLREQEKRTKTLYQLTLEIIKSSNKNECVVNISQSLSKFFNATISISLINDLGVLDYFKKGEDWIFNHPKEWAVSQYAFEKKIPAGKWTDTLPDAQSLFVPLVAKSNSVGVLGFNPKDERRTLSVSEREILFTICSQLAIYLERELYHESMLDNEKFRQSEKIHQTLLNSVSHEIKTPLTAIIGTIDSLNNPDNLKPNIFAGIHRSLKDAVERLRIVVENILDISRLTSGVLTLKQDWYDLDDIIGNVLDELADKLKDFVIEKKIPKKFPMVYIDGKFFEQVIHNLVLNSMKYSTVEKNLKIEVIEQSQTWSLIIADHGPGIKQEYREQIFQKFYRLPHEGPGGIGLGLSIVKSIVELHKGTIEVLDTSKGLAIKISLPKFPPPAIREEHL
jgi:two-component system sensor histidine kinase KdpD